MKTQSEDNLNIKVAIEGLYKSFREKDHDGMISAMTDDVWIRFLGQADFKGIQLASDFFKKSNALLDDLVFEITDTVIESPYAAVIWNETARTKNGDIWTNHGVDVYMVRDSKIEFLHENNDLSVHYLHFPQDQ